MFQDFPYGGRTERAPLLLQGVADLVDRVILLAQAHDESASGGLLGLGARSRACGNKEVGIGIAAEVMAKNLEGTGGVVEGVSHFGGGEFIDEIGTQCLVHTLLGVGGFEEESAAFA